MTTALILADTSVWIEHLRGTGLCALEDLLRKERIIFHPWIFGELMLGHLGPKKKEILLYFSLMKTAPEQAVSDVVKFTEKGALSGKGLSLVDVQLLATAVKEGHLLWTLDKALRKAAEKFSCALSAPLVK